MKIFSKKKLTWYQWVMLIIAFLTLMGGSIVIRSINNNDVENSYNTIVGPNNEFGGSENVVMGSNAKACGGSIAIGAGANAGCLD